MTYSSRKITVEHENNEQMTKRVKCGRKNKGINDRGEEQGRWLKFIEHAEKNSRFVVEEKYAKYSQKKLL